ncbi:MAG TPA: PEP-CTERM sorting domain-containing protein [Verrucomicrobiae bacterium]|jgi:hypothetical protein|nr:PEP-CTERM sorting domain-containing protein [Verrucomicrobiae bacterium]
MKLNAKWIVTAVTGMTALAAVNSALAQSATGNPTLGNMTAGQTTLYPGWSASPTVITPSAAGYEVSSTGYGSLYYANPTPIPLDAADTQVTLTFTLNGPAGAFYVGVPFILNDNAGPNSGTPYGGYNTFTFPGTYSETVNLTTAQQTAVAAGNDALYGFNLELDPAGNTPGNAYDITFNSLTLSAAPEPSTYALLGTGAATFAAFFRRKK